MIQASFFCYIRLHITHKSIWRRLFDKRNGFGVWNATEIIRDKVYRMLVVCNALQASAVLRVYAKSNEILVHNIDGIHLSLAEALTWLDLDKGKLIIIELIYKFFRPPIECVRLVEEILMPEGYNPTILTSPRRLWSGSRGHNK